MLLQRSCDSRPLFEDTRNVRNIGSSKMKCRLSTLSISKKKSYLRQLSLDKSMIPTAVKRKRPLNINRQAQFTKEKWKEALDTGMERWHGRMVLPTREIGKKVLPKGKVHSYIRMVISMKASGRIINALVMANISIRMEPHMLVCGRTICRMDKERKCGQKAPGMKVLMKMARSKDLANILGLTVHSIQVTGLITKLMV